MTAEGRTLDAQGNSVVHYIAFPLTCRFQIIKNSTLSAGSAIFQIYNLTADVRSDLYKDAFEQAIYKKITFAAGYQGEELPLIFQGNILIAYSYRQGPDWITEIQALDGGYARDNGIANITKPAPYSIEDLAKDVIGKMPKAEVGKIGALDLDQPAYRGITLNGNAWDLIARSIMPVGGRAFINNEQVYIVQQWEYIANQGNLTEIDADTGIIGTPRLQDAMVRARMIYEPRLQVQQTVHLTTLESRMSGDYIVQQLIHGGTISGAVCEDLITDVTMYNPNHDLVEVD